ncbi:hypothetical protein TSMEX_010479 [Taenia solium]|eukprot:TsM_000408400 transcript=TsM_000408400 gene=TsM_000408400
MVTIKWILRPEPIKILQVREMESETILCLGPHPLATSAPYCDLSTITRALIVLRPHAWANKDAFVYCLLGLTTRQAMQGQ